MSCRCVLTSVPGAGPLSNVDIELVRTDTMAIVQVVQTDKHGEAQFTADLPAPCFFRPRIIGKNWDLQVTDTGVRWSIYDRVVAKNGSGSDLTITSAIAALAATGGTIGVCSGDYHEGATLTIPGSKNYVIEGIGHGILEDVTYTPVMRVVIHNPAGAGGFNGVVFHVDSNARLTLRGIEVWQGRNYDAIEAHTAPFIILEDSYVHAEGTTAGAAVDTSYMLRVHRSVLESLTDDVIDVGTSIVYLEVTESRLTSPTYSVKGSFGAVYFEKCQMSKFYCNTTTIATKLRITDCKIGGGTAGEAGITVIGGAHLDVQIFDNEIDGGTSSAVNIGYVSAPTSKRFQVNNNRFKSTLGHGLYISGYVVGLTACGNIFTGNAAGYCIETALVGYPVNAVFGCNTIDDTALGVYGPTLPTGFAGEHHNLSGLLDDDHTQYLLASGARALSGNWNPGVHIIGNYDFTARPTALYVGDVNFELYIEAGGPVMVVDSGLDFMGYVRASNYFNFSIGGVECLRIGATGLLVDNINELVGAAGVTIETVLIKDGLVDGYDVSTLGAASHAAVTLSVVAEVLLGLSTQEIGLDTQAANLIFAGPAAGAVAAPTFRSLVLADIPAEIATWEGVIDMIGAVTSFYFTPVVSDLGGIYYNMTVAPSPAAATNFDTGSIGSDTNTLIYTSVSSVAETPANLVAGLIDLHIHALRVSGARNLRVYSTFHVRSAGGVDGAAFATTELSNLLTTASAEYDIHAIQAADQAFAVNERLVVNTYINSNGGTPNATVGRITIAGTTAAHISVGIDAAAFDHIYLTPAAHTAIGDGAPHHAAVTLSTDLASNLLGLSTQQITLDDQNIHTVFAGPVPPTASAPPAFRVLVESDLPDLSGTFMTPGAHTAIGDGAPHHAAITLAASAAILMDLTGQAISLDTQAANTFLAGRADVGAAQAPTFRTIVALDLGTGAPSGAKFLRDDLTWQVPAGGGGGGFQDAFFLV